MTRKSIAKRLVNPLVIISLIALLVSHIIEMILLMTHRTDKGGRGTTNKVVGSGVNSEDLEGNMPPKESMSDQKNKGLLPIHYGDKLPDTYYYETLNSNANCLIILLHTSDEDDTPKNLFTLTCINITQNRPCTILVTNRNHIARFRKINRDPKLISIFLLTKSKNKFRIKSFTNQQYQNMLEPTEQEAKICKQYLKDGIEIMRQLNDICKFDDDKIPNYTHLEALMATDERYADNLNAFKEMLTKNSIINRVKYDRYLQRILDNVGEPIEGITYDQKVANATKYSLDG